MQVSRVHFLESINIVSLAAARTIFLFIFAIRHCAPIFTNQTFCKGSHRFRRPSAIGAGTGDPADYSLAEWAIGFYWPKSTPLPPAGNPNLGGIIVGLIYDSATPNVWAKEMRAAFPCTHLLTEFQNQVVQVFGIWICRQCGWTSLRC